MNPAEEGFPWDRVDAAKRYLYTIKPWWSRFGERLKVVPTYVPPPEGMLYGAATSTDPGLRLYIDRTFAGVAPLHVLAGAIEHEFQHHTRDTWRRLTWLDPEEWRKWSNICLDLEINGGMDEEARRIEMTQVHVICSRSVLFSERDLSRWRVIAPPSLDEETVAWIPRVLGLPDRLSAEEYLRILQRSEELKQQEEEEQKGEDEDPPEEQNTEDERSNQEEQQSDKGEDGGSSEQDEQGEEQEEEQEDGAEEQGKEEGEESDSTPKSEETTSQDGDDEEEEKSDQSAGEQDGGEPGDESEDGGGEKSEAPNQLGEEGEGETKGEPEKSRESSTGRPEEGDAGQGDVQQADGEAAEPGEDEQPAAMAQEGSGKAGGEAGQLSETTSGNPDKKPPASTPQDAPGEGQQGAQPSSELGKQVQELRAHPANAIWAAELQNPMDDLSDPAWKPDDADNQKPVSQSEAELALAELEEDVLGAGEGPMGYGSGPGGTLLKWAHSHKKVRGLDWESRFLRLVSSAYDSAKISGASDLSYSVRNPNQQEFGPILQGLHDYAPRIYLMQDVSGSMKRNDGMSRSMSLFTDLATKVLGKFGGATTWITVDTKIIDVGIASRWSDNLQSRWSGGFGGTKLDQVISDTMQGKMRFKTRRYPAPDLLIITTDCMFDWPRRRPTRRSKLLVVSVAPLGDIERYLPAWLDRKRELIVID